MAKGKKRERTPKVAEAKEPKEAPAAPKEDEAEAEAPLALREASEESGDSAQADEADEADEAESLSEGDSGSLSEQSAVAEGDTTGAAAEEETAAAQLGSEKYVLAAFFAGGMILAYVVGRLIETTWAALANKIWFSRAVPALAAVGDEKTTYSMVIGGIVALIVVLRLYRNPEVRTWADEVAAELSKVKWPTKKDVTNSTFVVITATAVATLYLALLDRFWAFVTNIVYGDGS
jgi:preprotein translocase subunit SecE